MRYDELFYKAMLFLRKNVPQHSLFQAKFEHNSFVKNYFFQDAISKNYEIEENYFGNVHIIHEEEYCGVYILEIFPGRSIKWHSHNIMNECEMALTEMLLNENQYITPGTELYWEKNQIHCYSNYSERSSLILCIDQPKFIRSDEILCERPRNLREG